MLNRASTLQDIAVLGNVSRATVSLVLNGQASKHRIAPSTQKRVRDLITRTGYMPKAAAKALRSGRTRTLAFMTNLGSTDDKHRHVMFDDLFAGFLREAAARKYYVLVMDESSFDSMEDGYLPLIRAGMVDGCFLSVARPDDPRLDLLAENQKDAVVLGYFPERRPHHFPSLDVDNEALGFTVGRYLLSRGHRRVGYLGGQQSLTHHRLRARGLQRCFAAANVSFQQEWVAQLSRPHRHHRDKFRSVALDLIWKNKLTAVLTCDDYSALMLLDILRDEKLHVPDDVSVIGVNNSALARQTMPALTSIDLNIEAMGQRAARIMIDRLDGREDTIEHLVIPHELVERESVKAIGKPNKTSTP